MMAVIVVIGVLGVAVLLAIFGVVFRQTAG